MDDDVLPPPIEHSSKCMYTKLGSSGVNSAGCDDIADGATAVADEGAVAGVACVR